MEHSCRIQVLEEGRRQTEGEAGGRREGWRGERGGGGRGNEREGRGSGGRKRERKRKAGRKRGRGKEVVRRERVTRRRGSGWIKRGKKNEGGGEGRWEEVDINENDQNYREGSEVYIQKKVRYIYITEWIHLLIQWEQSIFAIMLQTSGQSKSHTQCGSLPKLSARKQNECKEWSLESQLERWSWDSITGCSWVRCCTSPFLINHVGTHTHTHTHTHTTCTYPHIHTHLLVAILEVTHSICPPLHLTNEALCGCPSIVCINSHHQQRTEGRVEHSPNCPIHPKLLLQVWCPKGIQHCRDEHIVTTCHAKAAGS